MLAEAAHVKFTHVPCPGGAQMITALLGKQVDFGVFARLLVLGQGRVGRLRYLALFGRERWAEMPDVLAL